MIDVHTETLIRLSEVQKRLPGLLPGKGVSIPTLWRWAQTGKLETVRIGGMRFTSVEAIDRFIGKTNPAPAPGRPSSVRKKSVEQAKRKLDALGI